MSNCEELKAWSVHSKKFLIIILGDYSIFVIQITILVTHVDEEGLLHESAFEVDPSSG